MHPKWFILAAVVVTATVWPPKVYMATRPTVTIEDIEDSVRTEVKERQQEKQNLPVNETVKVEPDSRDGERAAQASVAAEPEKTVILHSWLGGKIVVKRVGTQLYLSLFK